VLWQKMNLRQIRGVNIFSNVFFIAANIEKIMPV
jgi:hypothetical protein